LVNQIRYEPPRAVALAVLALVVVAAALLRFPSLGEQGLWRDEGGNLAAGQRFARRGDLPHRDRQLPTALQPAGLELGAAVRRREWVLRLPSAVLGVLNVALLYGLGARIGGRGVGLVAAALLALSGYHVWYSQEARMYALLACTATAHAWAMVHFLDRPRAARALLLGLSGIPLIYAHPYGALTWIGIGFGALCTIVLRRDWPAPAVAGAGRAAGRPELRAPGA
jgi:mannosyltransferase